MDPRQPTSNSPLHLGEIDPAVSIDVEEPERAGELAWTLLPLLLLLLLLFPLLLLLLLSLLLLLVPFPSPEGSEELVLRRPLGDHCEGQHELAEVDRAALVLVEGGEQVPGDAVLALTTSSSSSISSSSISSSSSSSFSSSSSPSPGEAVPTLATGEHLGEECVNLGSVK